MRYFRIADASLYESLRLQLDAIWGHPTADGLTVTCVTPAAVAPRDSQGRILLAVRQEFCEFAAVAEMLPQLLATGAVEEVTDSEYDAAVPPLPA